MYTIVRVKRKTTEDPVNCLIIECKRNKLEAIDDTINNKSDTLQNDETPRPVNGTTTASIMTNEDSVKEILKYAGSAHNEAEVSAKIIEFKTKFEKSTRIIKKTTKRLEPKLKQQSNKSAGAAENLAKETKSLNYVLVDKKRAFNASDTKYHEISQSKKLKALDEFNIIDIISSEYTQTTPTLEKTMASPSKISCNGIEMIREKVASSSSVSMIKDEEQFVYDIYFTKNLDLHLNLLYSNNYEIKSSSYDDVELVDEKNPENEDDKDYVANEDDEDSNDEGNWRNDYPDEDEYYDDADIDEENDEEGRCYNNHARRSLVNDEDYDDSNYNEYENDYSDEDDEEKKLSRFMKKSCVLEDNSFYEEDSENDDYDEYKNEDAPKSYNAYKRNLLKEIDNRGK
jgi:hypothetical protein